MYEKGKLGEESVSILYCSNICSWCDNNFPTVFLCHTKDQTKRETVLRTFKAITSYGTIISTSSLHLAMNSRVPEPPTDSAVRQGGEETHFFSLSLSLCLLSHFFPCPTEAQATRVRSDLALQTKREKPALCPGRPF